MDCRRIRWFWPMMLRTVALSSSSLEERRRRSRHVSACQTTRWSKSYGNLWSLAESRLRETGRKSEQALIREHRDRITAAAETSVASEAKREVVQAARAVDDLCYDSLGVFSTCGRRW